MGLPGLDATRVSVTGSVEGKPVTGSLSAD